MKVFKLVSFVMAIAMMFSVLQMPAFAEEADYAEGEVTYIFEEGISEEMKERIIAHFIGEESPASSTYSLCDLLGHKIEYTTSTRVTHKVASTAPRCLQKVYTVEVCTRCDYTTEYLASQSYIYCCS